MGVQGTASQFGVLGGPCLFSRIVHHPITSQDVSDINDRFRSCLYSISKFTCSLTTTEKRKNSTLLAFAPFFALVSWPLTGRSPRRLVTTRNRVATVHVSARITIRGQRNVLIFRRKARRCGQEPSEKMAKESNLVFVWLLLLCFFARSRPEQNESG